MKALFKLLEDYPLMRRVEIERDIIERDERDMNRDISPLRKADDAILVDSSDMSIEEVVSAIKEIINKDRES